MRGELAGHRLRAHVELRALSVREMPSVPGSTSELATLRARIAALEAENAALRDQREQAGIAAVFEAAPTPYLLLAPDAPVFTIVAANDAYLEATFTRRREILGRGLFAVFPANPHDPAGDGSGALRASLLDVIATRRPDHMAVQRYDIPLPAELGGGFGERWWSQVNTPVLGRDGGIRHIVHHAEDITGHERRRHAQQESQAAYRAIFEQAALGVALVGLDGSWRRVNGRLCAMLGYSEAELLARTFQDTTHSDDLVADEAHLLRLLAGETTTYSMEKRYVRKDGAQLWAHLTVSLLRDADGAPRNFISIIEDISARKQAEAALRDSEERLRLATEVAEIGFWDLDPIDNVLIWPPRVKAMFGISPDAPVSMEDFYTGLHPDDRPATSAAYAAAADPARRALYDVEYRTIGKEDGIIRWVAAKGRGVFDRSGRCVRVIGTAIDITARKAAEAELARSEAELRRLNESLETRVAGEIAAREQAQTRLAHAQRMEVLGQLAGGIAHDFNNVLQAVMGGLSLIERRADKPDAVRNLARMSADAVARGTAVAARLLAFARRGELRPVAIEAEPLLEGLKEMLEPTLGAGIAVRIAVAGQTPALVADRAQLETVLVNLAVNARDAMPAGGALTLSAGPPLPGHPAGPASAAHVRLDVTDTGTGMEPAVLARAAEPFFTTKPPGQGTGLGLAMARGFAQQSGGGLEITSVRGQGTTVTLWFPVASGTGPERVARGSGAGAVVAPGASALVVDDDAMVRAMLVGQMEALGFAVREAPDGPTALALLDAGAQPQLLVTDYSMPGMNGLELIGAARRRLPRLPVLLLTGFADTRLRDIEAAHDEQTIVLRKPVGETVLMQHVAKLLDAYRPGDEGTFAGGG